MVFTEWYELEPHLSIENVLCAFWTIFNYDIHQSFYIFGIIILHTYSFICYDRLKSSLHIISFSKKKKKGEISICIKCNLFTLEKKKKEKK